MSSRFKTALITGVPYGLFMGLMFGLTNRSWIAGLILGVISGVAFGLMMAWFMQWLQGRCLRKPITLPGEHIISQGAANHFRGIEAVGGWLFLTDRRLFFYSHDFNVQNHQLSIPRNEILQAEPCRTLGIVPNGLRIKTSDRVEQFVVQDRQSWLRHLAFSLI
ncbi:MAG: GRAM domain-containing protein [Planctomycetota bacterium]|nr:GRAM domain-containing protein [Planctomycetota bacterium]